MECKSNKRLLNFGIIVLVVVITLIGVGMFVTSEKVNRTQETPQISQTQDVNTTIINEIYIGDGRNIHDLTPVEWDGLKGIRGKKQLIEYLNSNPGATLSDAVVDVKGFGEGSAQIIERYIKDSEKENASE